MITVERREIVCKKCDKKFITKADHGVWPKFCSRACFKVGGDYPPIIKECNNCKKMFQATYNRKDGRYKIHCSSKCNSEIRREKRSCIQCNKQFSVYKLRTWRYCSRKCFGLDSRGEKGINYKGGKYVSESSGHVVVRHERNGYVGKYIGQHRIVAGETIGRQLFSHEIVIHIFGDKTDNAQDNLFICSTMSEYCRRRQGSLPWPTASNLKTYGDRENKAA